MDEKKEINIDKRKLPEREQILEDNKFIRFNKTNLISPAYIKTGDLKEHILNIKADYKYIDAITKGMTAENYILDQEEKIQLMKNKLEDLKNKTWSALWLEELDSLDKMVDEGIKTNWLFETKQHVFKNSGKSKNTKKEQTVKKPITKKK